MSVTYSLQVVGGPYDGVGGFTWVDDGEHPPPDEIFIGRCRGGGMCGSGECPGAPHAMYWLEREDEIPVKTVRYEKQEDFVRRHEYANGRVEFEGTAVYVMGGLDWLARMAQREKVPAGASGG